MEMLDKLIAQWKEHVGYKDVGAQFLGNLSDSQIVEKCPHGCPLVSYEGSEGGSPWREMMEYPDHYRQTLICRKHGYAMIYVTTGLGALGAGYNLRKR